MQNEAVKEVLGNLIKWAKGMMVKGMGDEEMSPDEMPEAGAVCGAEETEESPMESKTELTEGEEPGDDFEAYKRDEMKGKRPGGGPGKARQVAMIIAQARPMEGPKKGQSIPPQFLKGKGRRG